MNTSAAEEMGMIYLQMKLRDGSLITRKGGGGGATNRGGACEVLPLRKGRAGKVLAMLKGGHKKFWCSFYAVA